MGTGWGIEDPCECPVIPDDTRCLPISKQLKRRLHSALNDQKRWEELVCWLDNVCEQLNSIPLVIPGKDDDGSNLCTAPTTVDALDAGQPVYIDASGFARPASHATHLSASVFGLAAEDIGAMSSGCLITAGSFELLDWTAITGGVLLTPGAAYYLTASGGLTTSVPQPGVDDWNVRVGTAKSGTRFVVDPRDPWQITC